MFKILATVEEINKANPFENVEAYKDTIIFVNELIDKRVTLKKCISWMSSYTNGDPTYF